MTDQDDKDAGGRTLSPAELRATAKVIIARRQRAGVLASPVRLWPVVFADVQALSLEPRREASLALACYAPLFGCPEEW